MHHRDTHATEVFYRDRLITVVKKKGKKRKKKGPPPPPGIRASEQSSSTTGKVPLIRFLGLFWVCRQCIKVEFLKKSKD